MVTQAQRDKLAQRLLKPRSRDSGLADPALLQAFTEPDLASRLEATVKALAAGRVIVPLYPHKVADSIPDTQLDSAQTDEMTLVRLDSRREAMAVFSSATALAQTYPDARPAPLPTTRAALMALANPARLIIDDSIVIPRPAVAALAQRDTWLPSWRDLELKTIVNDLVADIPVEIVDFVAVAPAIDRLLVSVAPRADLSEVMGDLTGRLSTCQRLIVATDTIELAPVRTQ